MKPSALEYAAKLAAELKERFGFEEPAGKNFIHEWMLNFDIAICEAEYEEVKTMRAAFFQMREQLFVFARLSEGAQFSLGQMGLACTAAKLLVTALPSSFAGKVVIDKTELDQLRALAGLYREEIQRVAEAEMLRPATLTAGGAYDKPSYLDAARQLGEKLEAEVMFAYGGRQQITVENAFFEWSLTLERALRAKWEAQA